MTAWSRAGSLTSDRLRPRSVPQQQQSRNKNQGKNRESSKSKDVQKLERILDGLRQEATVRKDATGGCFCQARLHSLSKYTPNCLNCGLVLCDLQLPFYVCPHCSTPLVSPSSTSSLISQVEEELKQVLESEENERIREQQERERAAGAFPSLAMTTENDQLRTPVQSAHVLSINSKTKKATLSTFSTKPMSSPLPVQVKEKTVRISPPPSEVDYLKGSGSEPLTNWKNLRGESCTYVPLPTSGTQNTPNNKSAKNKKGKDALAVDSV